MSSAWTPAAGMLVALPDGRWASVVAFEHAVANVERSPMVLVTRLPSGNFSNQSVGTAKPLAPAVTHGGLFEALLQVPGAELIPTGYPMPSENQIRIPLEAGDLWMDRNGLRYHLFGNMAASDTYEARGRDWQREGAIRAYAAQPGWGGGE